MISILPFNKLLTSFDTVKLNEELSLLNANSWIDHVNKGNYQGSWQVLPLRCQQQYLYQHPVLQSFAIEGNSDWVNLAYVQSCSEIMRVLEYFQCDVKAARLMRLKPEAYIQPHRDKGLAMEYGEARFHLPICGTEKLVFLIDNKPVPMVAGELWYVNADMEHSVRIRGTKDRVSLVIDCLVNEWLVERISEFDYAKIS